MFIEICSKNMGELDGYSTVYGRFDVVPDGSRRGT